jgi:hypothetical protein|tara:strand:+ start:53 stop:277 length:225 start_codon:yes stop_codon:yes gene_type:complete
MVLHHVLKLRIALGASGQMSHKLGDHHSHRQVKKNKIFKQQSKEYTDMTIKKFDLLMDLKSHTRSFFLFRDTYL